jgi:Predicted membrane protein (DUF2207) C-terminal domain/Predicted membrane protein (DUF2207) N-terminal domain
MRLTAFQRWALAGLVSTCAGAVVLGADEGWLVRNFDSRIDIQPDGTLSILEAIDVDFHGQPHHGINRDIEWRFAYGADEIRLYPIDLLSVTRADGSRHTVKTTDEGSKKRFRIGDPNRTLSGTETYRIAYRVHDALNAFADHDELYWNVSGSWTVPLAHVLVEATAPGATFQRVDCLQGVAGSTERCTARLTTAGATFAATRPLAPNEQLTIVAALPKGAVVEPRPRLTGRPRDVTRFFEHTPAMLGATAAGLLLAVVGLGGLWWHMGRDRRYLTLDPASSTAADERVPLFGSRPIAVEFQPPDQLRPAQIGLLLDERADTLDVTATIVDLAARGYLTITELPRDHWFSRKDWRLDRLDKDESALLPYERIVLSGLFDLDQSRTISDLKNKFYDDLAKARKALYADAVARGWFPQNPNTVRVAARIAGLAGAAAGVWLLVVLGRRWGAGLLALPVVTAGVLLSLVAGAMPRRTAAGRTLMRRALGFRRYMRTAEVHQQAFAERANIFTEYLPYAVAFKCVEQWARAFKDIDLRQATAGWYAGGSGFNAGAFSSSLGSFSSSISSTLASTPGGSGGSGFSGGSSGGGGGGGGGSGW